ncbi:MAG: hypothetical protein KBC94_01700 [Pseudacidovorax sp.]|uniref:hypothetical protein n=1 Tax=Pseudacidovorax sp. TaxID=1934311 RepID=UPI001B3F129F|nr:hypothetical protein [Pseudacidovorax sp.]MBP6893108.1 hypothetical protein [Pseudacidovorax sp.]
MGGPHLIATRAAGRLGTCNICGAYEEMTEDHVPPKSCYRPSQMELRTIHARVSVEKFAGSPGPRKSQNGIKFKTLCRRCNNELLGLNYDPELVKFVNAISAFLRTEITLPEEVGIEIRPQYFMRAVLGHLAAVGVDRYLKGDDTEPFKEYMLDISKPLPEGFKFFYWLYTEKNHVLIRDAGMIAGTEPVIFWLLKFFPIAFFITRSGSVPRWRAPVLSLDPWRNLGAEDICTVPVRLTPIPHPLWPETPTHGSDAIMYSRDAYEVAAVASRPKLLNFRRR